MIRKGTDSLLGEVVHDVPSPNRKSQAYRHTCYNERGLPNTTACPSIDCHCTGGRQIVEAGLDGRSVVERRALGHDLAPLKNPVTHACQEANDKYRKLALD